MRPSLVTFSARRISQGWPMRRPVEEVAVTGLSHLRVWAGGRRLWRRMASPKRCRSVMVE